MQVKIVGKKQFGTAALDLGYETFVVHVVSFGSASNDQKDNIHLSYRVQIAVFVANESPMLISTKYLDFANVFSLQLLSELFEYTEINDQVIELVDQGQPSYRVIYSLASIEL